MNLTCTIKCIALVIITSATACWGLNSDNNQLLHISSNQATIDFQTGTVSYIGNVLANQGTRQLTGNKLKVNKAKTGGAQDVTAYGNPAKAQYQPTVESKLARGQAKMITYEFTSHIFKFQNDARLEQNNNVFTGPLIIYNTTSKVVHSPTNQLQPTTIILPPYNQEKPPHD